jgi:hypothetical protein
MLTSELANTEIRNLNFRLKTRLVALQCAYNLSVCVLQFVVQTYGQMDFKDRLQWQTYEPLGSIKEKNFFSS